WVPQTHGTVATGRGQGPAVGTEGQPKDPPGVARERALFLAGRHVPHPHQAVRVIATRGEQPFVGTERDRLPSPGTGPDLLPGGRVPDRQLLPAQGQELALAAERQMDPHPALTIKPVEFSAGWEIPDSHHVILAGRGEALAVGKKRHAADTRLVAA